MLSPFQDEFVLSARAGFGAHEADPIVYPGLSGVFTEAGACCVGERARIARETPNIYGV